MAGLRAALIALRQALGPPRFKGGDNMIEVSGQAQSMALCNDRIEKYNAAIREINARNAGKQ
jgi:hypothetical protein